MAFLLKLPLLVAKNNSVFNNYIFYRIFYYLNVPINCNSHYLFRTNCIFFKKNRQKNLPVQKMCVTLHRNFKLVR